MNCQGIRGAICVDLNNEQKILEATRELLEHIVAANDLSAEDIASVIFTATSDLDAAYPARAAREMGWLNTPLLCTQEMDVMDSVSRCIRVLILWNTDRGPGQIRHVYLGEARKLRPDLAKEGQT